MIAVMVLSKRMLPLLDGIDEPFGRIDLLFDKKNGFFLALIFFGAPVIFFHHIPVTFADAKLGGITGIQCQFQFPALLKIKKSGTT